MRPSPSTNPAKRDGAASWSRPASRTTCSSTSRRGSVARAADGSPQRSSTRSNRSSNVPIMPPSTALRRASRSRSASSTSGRVGTTSVGAAPASTCSAKRSNSCATLPQLAGPSRSVSGITGFYVAPSTSRLTAASDGAEVSIECRVDGERPDRQGQSCWGWTGPPGTCWCRWPSAASCRTWRGRWSRGGTAACSPACRRTAHRPGCRSRPARIPAATASSTSGRPACPANGGWSRPGRRRARSCGSWWTRPAVWRTWWRCRCRIRRRSSSAGRSCAACSRPGSRSTTPGRRS